MLCVDDIMREFLEVLDKESVDLKVLVQMKIYKIQKDSL